MKGIYILFISIKKNISVKIGALGRIKFSKGTYAYVGSAQNGIRQRVERHQRKHKKKHWHIDYLLANQNVKIERVFYRETRKKEDECLAVKRLIKGNESVKGFGCSDCRCNSHLIKLKKFKKVKELRELKDE